MADDQQEQDRTEPATAFKLREARRRGQVPKSTEVNSFILLAVALALLYFAGERLVVGELHTSGAVLSNAYAYPIDPAGLTRLFASLAGAVMAVFWPWVAAVVIAGILANLFQTGPVFSFFPVKPDVQRINPAMGFKRLFSLRTLYETVKTLVKLAVFTAVIYLVISSWLPSLMGLLDTSPKVYGAFLLEHVRLLLFDLLLVFFLVAMIDLAYSRWDYARQMRMSRRELKEEFKRHEGDPRIRAKRRELQREALKRAGSLQRVPDADVLITNPTHLAVALRYQRGVMAAPVVWAKGAGELAQRMREVARRHRVPVIENKALARRLFTEVEIDRGVPEALYPVVAKILVWAFAMRDGDLHVAGEGRP